MSEENTNTEEVVDMENCPPQDNTALLAKQKEVAEVEQEVLEEFLGYVESIECEGREKAKVDLEEAKAAINARQDNLEQALTDQGLTDAEHQEQLNKLKTRKEAIDNAFTQIFTGAEDENGDGVIDPIEAAKRIKEQLAENQGLIDQLNTLLDEAKAALDQIDAKLIEVDKKNLAQDEKINGAAETANNAVAAANDAQKASTQNAADILNKVSKADFEAKVKEIEGKLTSNPDGSGSGLTPKEITAIAEEQAKAAICEQLKLAKEQQEVEIAGLEAKRQVHVNFRDRLRAKAGKLNCVPEDGGDDAPVNPEDGGDSDPILSGLDA